MKKVQRGVRNAQLKLHDSNNDRLELSADEVIPGGDARTCAEQSLEVEIKLHQAANGLEVVCRLLATAEDEVAVLLYQSKDATMTDKRSGEGLSSLLAHIRQAAHKTSGIKPMETKNHRSLVGQKKWSIQKR